MALGRQQQQQERGFGRLRRGCARLAQQLRQHTLATQLAVALLLSLAWLALTQAGSVP